MNCITPKEQCKVKVLTSLMNQGSSVDISMSRISSFNVCIHGFTKFLKVFNFFLVGITQIFRDQKVKRCWNLTAVKVVLWCVTRHRKESIRCPSTFVPQGKTAGDDGILIYKA